MIGKPSADVPSLMPNKEAVTELRVLTLVFSLLPVTYLVEAIATSNGFRPGVYKIASILYVPIFTGAYFVLTKPGVRLRSYWRGSRDSFLGSSEQMRVPSATWLLYSAFWVVTMAIKLIFGYYALVEPLVPPVRALWQEPFARIGTGSCDRDTDLAACGFDVTVRCVLLLARTSVPFLVYHFDTYIFFNIASAFCSVTLAWYRNLGRVSNWGQLLQHMPQTIAFFDIKVIGCVEQEQYPEKQLSASTTALARFGGAWNTVVDSLRDCDVLSDTECRELRFGCISDAEFFGAVSPQYVLLPCMLTSPVYVASAMGLLRHRSYPCFQLAVTQVRDLTAWLCVRLGVACAEERDELLQVFEEIASLAMQHIERQPQGGAADGALLRLHGQYVVLIKELLRLHADVVTRALVSKVTADDSLSSDETTQAHATAALATAASHLKELTATSVKGLFVEHGSVSVSMSAAAQRAAEAWRRLQLLVRAEMLLTVNPIGALHALTTLEVGHVLATLNRAFTCPNPGSEPRSEEAKRQLLFFANSLHNRRLVRPPPVHQMKTWSALTPCV